MSLALETSALTAGYGSQPVVRDLDIEVGSGEVVTLLGANGAGKTTTLLAISGLLPPLSGQVRIDGVPATRPLHKRARAGLAYVTDERSIFRTMSLADNLKAGNVRIEDALALFPELEKCRDLRAGLMSGGEQQMLSLARALCRKPSLLLIDEMSLGLAPLVVERLLKAVRRAAADGGCAVLLVEQHARKAMQYADRVYVMRRGRIEMNLPASQARARIDEIESSYMSSGTETES